MPTPGPAGLSTLQVLACGAFIVTLSMGIRHGFGLWLQPVTQSQGWTRETFAFALAVQNLSWGVFGIFAGMAADRFGAFKVLVMGAVLYALGLVGMAMSTTSVGFALTAGILIGAAQAGTTYAVIYGVIGRQIPAEKRSWAMGVAAAAGSFGQFLMVPVEGWLISSFGWQEALMVLGAAVLLIMPLAWGLREPGFAGGTMPKRYILAFIYLARAVAISIFLIVPLSPVSVYVFSAVMGVLWLSTVPPTNAVVAQIFGVAHLSMLGGFVFFSHQIGSFMGVWLGGVLYDRTGSYNIVWYISIALGVMAALINLPVRESAIVRGTQRVGAAA
ncbi:MAG: MFS transporter [Hydrogenophaga sp.]|nr:MFS transporter [Hydrogenophaga sp.]